MCTQTDTLCLVHETRVTRRKPTAMVTGRRVGVFERAADPLRFGRVNRMLHALAPNTRAYLRLFQKLSSNTSRNGKYLNAGNVRFIIYPTVYCNMTSKPGNTSHDIII